MPKNFSGKGNSIVFGVTAPQSLQLLGNLPLKMSNQGWSVSIVSGREVNGEDPWEGKITITTIPMSRTPAPLSDTAALIRWFTLLRKSRPDILAVATPKAALLGLLAARICGVPHRVYFLWGLRLETSIGPSRRILWLLERLGSACATTILAVSPSLSQAYSNLRLAKEGKIKVIGAGSSHGVDLKRFAPRPDRNAIAELLAPDLKLEIPTLGFVGRFSRDKGAVSLLNMAQYLHGRGQTFQLLVVGPVEDSGRALAQIANFCERVVVVGEAEDTAPYYCLLDILLLPTKREGFPNVVLEASASGIPAVTTSATGAIDSVLHMKTGLVASLGSDLDFARSVEMLLTRPELIESFGTSARNWVSLNFSSVTIEDAYLSAMELMAQNISSER